MSDFVRLDIAQDGPSLQRVTAMINAELRAEVAAGRRRTVMTLWALLSLPALYFATRADLATVRWTVTAVWGFAGLTTALGWLVELRWRQRAESLAASVDRPPENLR